MSLLPNRDIWSCQYVFLLEIDKLDQGCQGKDLIYSLGKKEMARQERIREVAHNVHTYDNVIDYLSAMEWPVRSKIFSDNFFVLNNFKLICIERETVNKHVK